MAGYFGAGDCIALEKLVPKKLCCEPAKTKDEKINDGSIKKTPVGDDASKGQKEGGESSSSDSSSSMENEGGEEIDDISRKKSHKSRKSNKSKQSKTSKSGNKSDSQYDGGSKAPTA